ncbi:unnamed protein product [Phytophthora fragariaefolia]|uniref:Unnamed protein product n=1 Tax=Phytophthora fragariaefolia TaxID=1490495 RepID=A0A9W6XZJ3_9STRA|nr:unnamed protein product [Phytophthora fragariaefolia]
MQRLHREIRDLQTVVDSDSSDMIQDLRGQIDQQASEIADLNRRLNRIWQERDSAEVACAHLEREIRRAGDEIQDLQASLADRKREVDMVRDELSATLGTLDRVRSDLPRAESTLTPASQPSAGMTATLRAERDAAITEARWITASLDRAIADLHQGTIDRDAARTEILDLRDDDTQNEYRHLRGLHDQTDAELRQASSLLSEVVEWVDHCRGDLSPLAKRGRSRSSSPGSDQPQDKRSHSSPPPDRTPTPPPSDHADREGGSSGSGRETSQEASGDKTSWCSHDLSEIQDDGGELSSPERTPVQVDGEEHHTPEPSSSGHEDQISSVSNRSSEGEEETGQSADSTDDEILAARSRSRSEARRTSIPQGGADQPIDLSGSQNQQNQPPPSTGSQHSAGQLPQQTPDQPPPPSPPSSPDSLPGTPPRPVRSTLTPLRFPVGNSLPGFDRIRQFTQAEVDPWPSRLLNQIQITGMILLTLTKRLVTEPGWLFPRKIRGTAVSAPGTEYRDDLITGAHVQDLLDSRPWTVLANPRQPLTFDLDLHRNAQSPLGRIAEAYLAFEERHLQAFWVTTHYLPITRVHRQSDAGLDRYYNERRQRRINLGERWRHLLTDFLAMMREQWADVDLLLDPFFSQIPSWT